MIRPRSSCSAPHHHLQLLLPQTDELQLHLLLVVLGRVVSPDRRGRRLNRPTLGHRLLAWQDGGLGRRTMRLGGRGALGLDWRCTENGGSGLGNRPIGRERRGRRAQHRCGRRARLVRLRRRVRRLGRRSARHAGPRLRLGGLRQRRLTVVRRVLRSAVG